MRKIIPMMTIYRKAIDEGEWNIEYGKEGTSFAFDTYIDLRYDEYVFNYERANRLYIVSRDKVKKFYAENTKIKIRKFSMYRLLIPLSICEKVDLSKKICD